MIYFTVWVGVGLAMLFTLLHRTQLDVNVVPDRNPLYVTLSDGAIRNGYTVKILNKRQEARTFRLSLDELPGATMEMVGESGAKGTSFDIPVDADKLKAVKIYVSTSDPRHHRARAQPLRIQGRGTEPHGRCRGRDGRLRRHLPRAATDKE